MARLAEVGRLFRPEPGLPPVGPSTVVTTLNLAAHRPIRASSSPDTVGPDLANDGSFRSGWEAEKPGESWLAVDLPAGSAFTLLTLSEPVDGSADYPATRIARYAFEASDDGRTWRTIAGGTDGRPVRMRAVPRQSAGTVRLRLWPAGDAAPRVTEIGVYDEPARVVRPIG